jgi:hypothetical protein
MIYSQLDYIGCVIPVPDRIIKDIETLIYNFVSGNLRIAKDRAFLCTELGGLGLFNVKKFLVAQTCSWVRRCQPIDQDWKERLLSAGTGNIYRINPRIFTDGLFPVLKNIATCFSDFTENFTKRNKNYQQAYLLNNNALTIGIRSNVSLTEDDILPLINDNPAVASRLQNLKMTDLLAEGTKISKRAFSTDMGVQTTDELWRKLDKLRNTAILRYNSDANFYSQEESMSDFFRRWKKGSRNVRLVLCFKKIDYIPHNIVKFSDNTDTIIGLECARFLNKSWNRHYLSNELRVFLFKLHNNTLPFNTILSHFVRGTSRTCTFCVIDRNPEGEDETPLHFFFNCPVSERIREDFFKWIMNDNTFSVQQTEFFTFFRNNNNFLNEALFIITQLFMYFLWNCKQRAILPVPSHLRRFILHEIGLLKTMYKKLSLVFENSGIDFEALTNGEEQNVRF